jgi:HEAT repeat protein
MKRLFVIAVLATGCGQPAQPISAGGKPVSFWVEALKDPDAKLRKKAVAKLGNVGQADPAALPAVLDALKDPDARVRTEAVQAVLKFGSGAKKAVPALTELQQDPDPQVRSSAVAVLGKVR